MSGMPTPTKPSPTPETHDTAMFTVFDLSAFFPNFFICFLSGLRLAAYSLTLKSISCFSLLYVFSITGDPFSNITSKALLKAILRVSLSLAGTCGSSLAFKAGGLAFILADINLSSFFKRLFHSFSIGVNFVPIL